MANPQAGWYADPSGDLTKLRYWDGEQWTDHYTDALQVVQPAAQPTAAAEPATPMSAPQPAAVSQPTPVPVPQPAPAPQNEPQAPVQPQMPQGDYAQPVQPEMPQSPYAQTTPAVPYEQTFAMSETDRTMRLVAFVFCIISTVCAAMLIIPLAWMIPMSIRSWKIYKGTKPNTTGFGVCTLIFVSLVSGILLLVSKKDVA